MTGSYGLWRSPRFSVGVAAIVLSLSGIFFYQDRLTAVRQLPATCEAPAQSIIPAEWGGKYMAPGNIYYETLFSAGARAAILGMAPAPVPPFSQGSVEKQRDLLSKGRFLVVEGQPEPAIDDIEWSVTDYGKYYSTQLHALAGVGKLLDQAVPMDSGIAKSLSALLQNWALCVAGNPGINDRAWYEGTVIKRLSVLLLVLNYMRKHGEVADFSYKNLIYLIDLHVNYLLDTENVYKFGNHGIRQDLLLAATATHLPMHPRATEMLHLAESRLNEAADTLFTKEGVWLEHAPGYVNYVLRLMLDVKLIDDYNASFNPIRFADRFVRSSDYLLKSLTPDASIPWIGMSSMAGISGGVRDSIVKKVGKPVEEQLSNLSNTVQVFEGYGHAIVRGRHPGGLYLIFVAAQNLPAGKRHADDLSFILYNHGRVWITEGGHQSYELSGMTNYLRSPLAHNTYTIGDEYVGAEESPELKAYIKTVETGTFGTEIIGFTERFPVKASVQRGITVDPGFTSLVIRDQLQVADNSGPWLGRLHFPPDLRIETNGSVLTANDPSTGNTLFINITAAQPLRFERFSGEKEPVRGWGISNGKLGPVTTIQYALERAGEVTMTLHWK